MKKTGRQPGVCVIGVQPPPVHGMAVVNAHVARQFAQASDNASTNIVIIDLAPGTLSRSRVRRLGRIAKVMKGLMNAARTRSSWKTVYMSVSGGYGQIYEILFVLLGRCLGARLFLHHHSFAYLDSPFWITRMLTSLAGKNASHIVLCQKMGKMLSSVYPPAAQIHVLSNISLIDSGSFEFAVVTVSSSRHHFVEL